MKEQDNNKLKDHDFINSEVSIESRKSFLSVTIVWLGFILVITSMLTGGALSTGLSFDKILIAVIFGNLFLSIIAITISYIAARTGLSFALIIRYSFGEKGSKIAIIIPTLVSIGWFTIQSSLYGHFISQILGISGVGEYIIYFLSTIIMGLFAFSGIKVLSVLSHVAIPSIIFLSIGTTLRSLMSNGIDVLLSWQPKEEISLITGMTMVIGIWIVAVSTRIADIMRYAKNPKEAMLSAVIGIMGGNGLLFICGAIATITMKESDLTRVLLGLGLIVPSLILLTTNIFTANASNLYSVSLNLGNVFRFSRKQVIFIVMIIAGFLTWTKPYKIEILKVFLSFLGIIIPPLAGIIIGDFFIIHKRNYPKLQFLSTTRFHLLPWVAWGISFILAMILFYLADHHVIWKVFSLPAMNGLIIALVIYPLLYKIKKNRKSGDLLEP